MPVLLIHAPLLAIGYSVIMAVGLVTSLILASRLHFAEVTTTHCKTAEYWPSISATTGDFFIPRTAWRAAVVIGFALRILVSSMALRTYQQKSSAIDGTASKEEEAHVHDSDADGDLPRTLAHHRGRSVAHWVSSSTILGALALCDFLRIFSALGWTLIASAEDLLFHEISFGIYMISGFVLQIAQVVLVRRQLVAGSGDPKVALSYRLKRIGLVGQTVCAVLVVKFFIDHNATCEPGLYSRSTMCEWGFAFFNLFFDATQWLELSGQTVSLGSGSGGELLTLAARPSEAALWSAEVFMAYFAVSSLVQLYQNVYFIPMVAMRFTPEVLLVCAALSPLLLRIGLLTRGAAWVARTARAATGLEAHRAALPPSWVALYAVALLSYFSFDVTRDAGNKLVMVGVGPLFWFLGFFQRLHTTGYGVPGRDGGSCGDTARLIYALPLGLFVNCVARVAYISLDPLHVSAVFNVAFGVLGGACALVVLWRAAAFAAPVDVGAAEGDEDGVGAAVAAPAPSAGLCGVLFGGVLTLALMLVTTYNVLPRFVGLDPYPVGLLVPLAFLAGALYHRNLVYSPATLAAPLEPRRQHELAAAADSERGGRGHAWRLQRLAALMLCGFTVMYFGTTQSNRMFEKAVGQGGLPGGTGPETPLERVEIGQWYVEEMSGSPTVAFCGGLVFVASLGAVFPYAMSLAFVATRATRGGAAAFTGTRWYCGMEVTFFATHVVLLMLNVYVVCFPFVPGGFLVRDRMWLVLLAPVACIWVPLLWLVGGSKGGDGGAAAVRGAGLRVGIVPAPTRVAWSLLALLLVVVILRAVAAAPERDAGAVLSVLPLYDARTDRVNDALLRAARELYDAEVSAKNANVDVRARKGEMSSVKALLLERKRRAVAFLARRRVQDELGKAGEIIQSGSSPAQALTAASEVAPISTMIWTIHFGLDNFGVDSVARLAQKVKETGAGIIGLLETDSLRMFNGNRDVVEYIAATLGYPHTDFGPTTLDSTFGCALITKYPIVGVKRYVMPSPAGELACLIHAQLNIGGVVVHTYVGHWGNTDHIQDTRLQSQFLGQLARANPGPSIFLGYLTTDPGKGNYNFFVAPASDPSIAAVQDSVSEVTEGDGSKSWLSKPKPVVYSGGDGLFRDTARDLYEGRAWKWMSMYGGSSGEGDSSDEHVRPLDRNYKRPAEGETPRVFYFPDTQRFSTAHPRFEFIDRYCQYILWKSGRETEEHVDAVRKSIAGRASSPGSTSPASYKEAFPVYLDFVDWWRILDIDDLSDTEIQVAHFLLRS